MGGNFLPDFCGEKRCFTSTFRCIVVFHSMSPLSPPRRYSAPGVLWSRKMKVIFPAPPCVCVLSGAAKSTRGGITKAQFTCAVSLSSVTKSQFQPPLSFSLLLCLFICSTLCRGAYYNAFVSFRTGFVIIQEHVQTLQRKKWFVIVKHKTLVCVGGGWLACLFVCF